MPLWHNKCDKRCDHQSIPITNLKKHMKRHTMQRGERGRQQDNCFLHWPAHPGQGGGTERDFYGAWCEGSRGGVVKKMWSEQSWNAYQTHQSMMYKMYEDLLEPTTDRQCVLKGGGETFMRLEFPIWRIWKHLFQSPLQDHSICWGKNMKTENIHCVLKTAYSCFNNSIYDVERDKKDWTFGDWGSLFVWRTCLYPFLYICSTVNWADRCWLDFHKQTIGSCNKMRIIAGFPNKSWQASVASWPNISCNDPQSATPVNYCLLLLHSHTE